MIKLKNIVLEIRKKYLKEVGESQMTQGTTPTAPTATTPPDLDSEIDDIHGNIQHPATQKMMGGLHKDMWNDSFDVPQGFTPSQATETSRRTAFDSLKNHHVANTDATQDADAQAKYHHWGRSMDRDIDDHNADSNIDPYDNGAEARYPSKNAGGW